MPAIGFVTKQSDGCYKGELKTLTIRAAIEIRPNLTKTSDRHADYRVFAANNKEIGTGRIKITQESQSEFIALQLAAPEFGSRRLFATVNPVAGKEAEDLYAINWNPES